VGDIFITFFQFNRHSQPPAIFDMLCWLMEGDSRQIGWASVDFRNVCTIEQSRLCVSQ
jgi:hypothetical protein